MYFSDNSYPLPGWLLRIAEVSNERYIVSLADTNKRRVEITCFNAELAKTVVDCVSWARKVEAGNDQIDSQHNG